MGIGGFNYGYGKCKGFIPETGRICDQTVRSADGCEASVTPKIWFIVVNDGTFS